MEKIPGYIIERELHKNLEYRSFLVLREEDRCLLLMRLYDRNTISCAKIKEEFKIVREISHPSILKYLDFFETKMGFYVITENFNFPSLDLAIPDLGFEPNFFLELAIQIVSGLVEIHDKNIIHQLLTPQHILYDSVSTVIKISGFKNVSHRDHLIRTDISSLKNHIHYISPEQTGRMNRYVDYRSDIYSLGILFYKMLTNRTPFVSEDLLGMIHAHIAQKPEDPSLIKPSIPKILSDILLKMLQKNCDERYQSAEGLLYDLSYCRDNFSKSSQFSIAQKDYSAQFNIKQKIYGRERELTILCNKFVQVLNGETVFLLLTGYSGIGKSAIVYEFQKEIVIQGAYFASGKYEEKKKNCSYSAIAEVFKDLLRQILRESDSKVETWKKYFQKAVGQNGQVIIDVIPELELIIGKQPSVEKLGILESQNRFNITFQKFVAVFDELTHPLVLFLDDLQWIDLASLNLIKLLVSERLTKSFLFIGAYRSNEVGPEHAVSKAIQYIKNTNVETEFIHLSSLDIESINQWISESFQSDPESTKKLTRLVKEKTNGNPFFVKTFLVNLYRENLVYYTKEKKWEWNFDEIIASRPTDNVMDLMLANLKKLPKESLSLITLASFIGTNFDVYTLSVVSEFTKEEIYVLLYPILSTGMIIKVSEGYKFIHDKVLEAAYSLVPDSSKPEVHLKVGFSLLEYLGDEEIENNLFDIVEHLNIGSELITEKEIQFSLNIRAAKKALESSAYKNAGHYFKIASELLHPNSWQNEYKKTLDLYTSWAEAEYMSSHFDQAEELFQIILTHAKSLLDKCVIYQMMIVHNENTRKFREAVDLAVELINELGIDYPHPKTITDKDIEDQIQKFYSNIEEKSIDELLLLPLVEDKRQEAVIGIMVSVLVPYWNTYPKALVYHSCEIVNRSIEYGLCVEATIGFSMAASSLIVMPERVDVGYSLGSLAIKIAERLQSNFYITAANYMFFNHVAFWKNGLRWGLEDLIHSYYIGIETGNIQWASYCLSQYCLRGLAAGDSLESVRKNYSIYTEPMYRLKQDAPLTYFDPPRQAVYNLLGEVKDPLRLIGKAFNEELELKIFYETKQFSATGLVYFCKLFLYVVFTEYQKAHEIALLENCERDIRASGGQYQPYLALCFYAITLLRNYNEVDAQTKEKYLCKAEELLKEFFLYKEINEENFSMIYYLISAEIYRVKEKYIDALYDYDRAIDESKKYGYLYFEGIANELCSHLWKHQRKNKIAMEYLKEAYNAFQKWGSVAKLRFMEKMYSEFAEQRREKNSFYLDIDSIQKATLALSSKLDKKALMSKLVQIIIENAGAQRGYIILYTEGKLVIQGGFDIENDELENDLYQSITNTNLLSEAVVRYVARTGKNLILKDASNVGDFTNDMYVLQNRAKSILAMPILFEKETQGVLFLENNLATDVFTMERIELLKIILSQAAISFENAQLYSKSIKNQKELVKLRNYLSNIINSMPSLLIGVNVEGMITQWNIEAERKTGISSQHALGQPLESVIPHLKAELAKVKESIRRRILQNNRKRIRKEGSETFYENITIYPLITNGVEGAVIRVDDITEQVRLEEMMLQSEKMLSVGGLAAGMAHEINNPLAGMMQTADVLRNRLTNLTIPANLQAAKKAELSIEGIKKFMEARRIPEMLDNIKKSGVRAAEIVQNMLSFARKGSDIKSKENLEKILDKCLELSSLDYDLKKNYDFRQIEIIKEYDENVPLVSCEAGKIQQVLMNLLKNGAEAMQEKTGKSRFILRLLHEKEKNVVRIEIEDNGPGIPEKICKRIFEPFFTTKPTHRGTGLGLSVSYFIITENHHGEMWVESKSGLKTTFVIRLPID